LLAVFCSAHYFSYVFLAFMSILFPEKAKEDKGATSTEVGAVRKFRIARFAAADALCNEQKKSLGKDFSFFARSSAKVVLEEAI